MHLNELFGKSSPSAKSVHTRFRAYKLDKAGSLYSYFSGNHFTLVEAMDSETSRYNLIEEMQICGKKYIDTLHITSWDNDHCEAKALEWILDELKPKKIEIPGYSHDSDSTKECKRIIKKYKENISRNSNIISITPEYISSLKSSSSLGYQNILYHPKTIFKKSNNNSTVKFFRSGSFNVLSTGDIEHHDIGSYLKNCKKLKREIDVLILPHHGGPVDLMTRNFLECLNPSLAICTSNTGNQHEHPANSIRDLLKNLDIPLMTTKRGDVLIESIGNHINKYKCYDLLSDGISSQEIKTLTPRKYELMSMNADTIRDRLNHRNTWPRRR
ncbi:hypothetical protein [Aeromonas veronii]|uniref:hypothetical protein n=1 Tax=Aeromonas TaxID=642 RepID=UPI0011179F7B|nr:hypothetical protein [Aeromonas veronii]